MFSTRRFNERGTHYDPHRVQCSTADRVRTRLIFAIEAAHKWCIGHMDIVKPMPMSH